jgi:hypothetical protein
MQLNQHPPIAAYAYLPLSLHSKNTAVSSFPTAHTASSRFFSPIPQQTPLPIATQRSFEQAGLQENEAATGKCAASHALSSSPDDSDQDIPCYSATAAGIRGPTNLLEILEHIAKVTLLAVSYCSCWHGVREGVVGGTSNFRVA